ncbi:BTB domain-containing protein [Haematococcus lacustris]|uniref:BTB domain-containing protein n=1 Tax=Haematococcus lacustris TaxID=44745 RepID=A0A699YCX0_HAELA|nr:BTB domain-containing protein [Haematococcus lacustris]
MMRPVFAWLWGDDTLSDATLKLCLADKSVDAPCSATLPVHRALLAAHSEYFKARLLRWASSGSQGAASFQPSTVVAHFAETGHLPSGLTVSQLAQACKEAKVQDALRCAEACSQALVDLAVEQPEPSQLPTPCLEETFDSQAECDAARLVVRCMYEGELAEEVKDPLTLARVCRVAERWAFPSLSTTCLQKLVDLPPSQLPVQQLVLVLQTLPGSCALLPDHKRWQERVHNLAVELNALLLLLHLCEDVHAVITSAQLRTAFQQLPFAAVQQWAGSDELTVDSENSVVELISLWMAGPEGRVASQTRKQQLSCLVRVQHLSPGLTSLPSHPEAEQLHHAVLTVHCQLIAACPLLHCCKGQLLEGCPQLGAGDDGVDIPVETDDEVVDKLLPLLVLRQQGTAVRQGLQHQHQLLRCQL